MIYNYRLEENTEGEYFIHLTWAVVSPDGPSGYLIQNTTIEINQETYCDLFESGTRIISEEDLARIKNR